MERRHPACVSGGWVSEQFFDNTISPVKSFCAGSPKMGDAACINGMTKQFLLLRWPGKLGNMVDSSVSPAQRYGETASFPGFIRGGDGIR